MRSEFPQARRVAAASVAALALLVLQGCATTAAPNPRDPWEPFNRQMTEVNEGIDRVVLRPSATFYREKVPPLVRTGVSNFFNNLSDAWSAINALLQFRLQAAEENFARFHVNTMFGVFGIFDVASDLNIERHREDFGTTLGRWGVPAGPYVVLPLFGPSTLRDTAALPVDIHYDLVNQVDPTGTRVGLSTLRVVDRRSNLLRASSVLEEASLDRYAFIRDAYLQRRRAEIWRPEGESVEVPPPLTEEPRYDLEPPPEAPAQ